MAEVPYDPDCCEGYQSDSGNRYRGKFSQSRTTCLGHETYIGDLNDPQALLNKVATRANTLSCKASLGTKPTEFYIV